MINCTFQAFIAHALCASKFPISPRQRIFIDFVYKIAQLKKIKNKNLFFKK
jgi:hypothetical protein